MVSFLIELRIAEHADINLRRYLKWIRRPMLSVPAPNRFHILSEVGEEPLPRRRDVSDECSGIVTSTEQHEVIQS